MLLGQAVPRHLLNSVRIAASMTGKLVRLIMGRGRTIPLVPNGRLIGEQEYIEQR